MGSQGRSSAMLSMVLLLVSAAAVVQGATYNVGDTAGWKIPGTMGTTPTYLADWAANKTFAVGDSVVFVYGVGNHDVLTVTAADYSACNLTAPLLKSTTGIDSLVLTAGANHYICGISGHCMEGQKITINATAASPGTISPPAAPGTPGTPASANNAAGNAVTMFQVLAAVMVSLVGSLAFW